MSQFPEPTVESVTQNALSRLRRERDRFLWQIQYANALAELVPGSAGRWRPLIDKARKVVARIKDGSGPGDLSKAVDEAESILAPLAAEAKRRVVHVIGHSHIDMNWQWSWQETVATTCDTFGTVLKIMDMFPEMKFTQSQCSCYRICEQYEPELLRRIGVQVKAGRWESVASSWVEGDRNLAGSESLAMHLLESRRYMQELFGLSPEDVPVDWSPDTFGFAATTPVFLAQGGIKYMYLHRPGNRTEPKPELFWWVGPDGSRVLVRNDMKSAYVGGPDPRRLLDNLTRMERDCGLRGSMLLYGFGDHGGAPNIRYMRQLEAMRTWPIFPEIRYSTAREFFEKAEKAVGGRLRELRGELNAEFTGCYTSQSLIKRCNRYSEKRMQDVEAVLAVSGRLAGHGGNRQALRECWRRTLFSHFHDILPGSGVHDTRTYTHGQFQETMATTSREETVGLRALAAQVDTSAVGAAAPRSEPANPDDDHTGFAAGAGIGVADGSLSQADHTGGRGGRVCVAFNPTPWERDEVVETLVWDDLYSRLGEPGARPSFSVVDASGKAVKAQALEYRDYDAHRCARIAFPVRVPALGWASVAVREEDAPEWSRDVVRMLTPEHHCYYARNERTVLGFENGRVRVVLDAGTGGIARITDRKTGVDLVRADSPVPNPLEFLIEHSPHMTAWIVGPNGPGESPRVIGVKTAFAGPLKAVVEFAIRIRESDFTLSYELRAGDPALYVRLSGTWFQRGSGAEGVPALRAVFPTALGDAALRCEIPYGSISRGLRNGEEEPALRWAAIEGKSAGGRKAGLLLMSDSKHGYSLAGGALRLSLIRSSIDPDPLPEIGRHDIRLALMPYVGAMPDAEAIRSAECFEREVKLFTTVAHDGRLPAVAGLISTGPRGKVVPSALKRAEDDPNSLIVRLFSTDRMPVTANLKVNPLLGKVRSAAVVDLMERPLKTKAAVAGSVVKVRIPARGMVSVKVTLQR